MKISILSTTVCQPTENIIKYFSKNGLIIDSVIIEKNYRKRFSTSEKKFRATHDKFNKTFKKYSLVRRTARRIWDILPLVIRKNILINIKSIPILRKFSTYSVCKKYNIEAIEVVKHSSIETKQILEQRKIDYVLMVSSNWLLKEPILSLPNTRIINAHSGWLPKHKGLDSIAWSILENDPVGLTTHFIDAGIDSGDILKFYEITIEKGDDFNSVTKKISNLQPFAFLDTLQNLQKNTIKPIPQNDEFKPHTPMSYEQLCLINEKLKNL